MICHSGVCASQSPGGCGTKRLLENSPYRSLRDLSCRCDQGVLYIQGRVSSYYEKQLAQEAVAGLLGAVRVVNEICVAADPPRD